MKKSIVILFAIISIFVASCAPQVTVTSEVTVTSLPPTATQTPEPSATPTVVYTPTPDKEIITNPSGIGFELGAQIEGQPEGLREVLDIVPTEGMNAEKQDLFEIRTNPLTFGFLEGETQLVYIPTPAEEHQKFRIELQRTSNPADVIAVFGSKDFVWKTGETLGENGDQVFLNAGEIVAVSNRVIADIKTSHDSLDLFYSLAEVLNLKYDPNKEVEFFVFISKDGKRGVLVNFIHDKGSKKGILSFMDKDKKTVRWIYVEDFDQTLSFIETLHQ